MAFGCARLVEAGFGIRPWASAAPATAAVTEKLELLQHHPHLAAFLLGVLVLPLIELQSTLHEKGPAFYAILGDRLALFAPGLDIDEDDFLAAFSGLQFELPVNREAKLAYWRPLGRHAQLGVAGEISHQKDFVERRHAWG